MTPPQALSTPMAEPVAERARMVREMDRELTDGRFDFVTRQEPVEGRLTGMAICLFREREGLSMIRPAALAPAEPALRMIRLNAHSALDGVGLTAAVSGALAAAGIPANVVAAFHHDHIFVPEAMADRALAVLRDAAATPET